MHDLSLNYKAQNEDIYLLTGSLLHAPSQSSLENSYLLLQKDILHICYFDKMSVPSLDDAFQSSIKEHSFLDFIKLKFPSRAFAIVSLFLVLLIVLAMGLFSAYGNAVYDLIIEAIEPSNSTLRKVGVFFGLLVLVILTIYLFPTVFKGEVKNFINRISGMYYSTEYYRKRFEKYLSIYSKVLSVKKIVIWNPANKGFRDIVYWETLIKACLSSSSFEAYFCIHTDERYKTELMIDKIYKQTEYDICNKDIGLIFSRPKKQLPKEYLNKTELQLLELILFCSTKNIKMINPDFKFEGYSCDTEHVVSLNFVEYLIQNFPERFPALNEFIDGIPLLVFFRRCVNDYGFLLDCYRDDLKLMCINTNSSLMNELYTNIHDELAFVYHYCHENATKIIKDVTDPVTAIILNVLFFNISIYSKTRIFLLEKLIFSADDYEHYFLFGTYWSVLFYDENENKSISPYILINVKAARRLSICFERAGIYNSAYDLHELLITLYPFHSSVSQARIHERQGEYDKAISKLNSVFKDFNFSIDNLPFEEKIKYLLTYSWTVVSGRLMAEKADGEKCLEKAKQMIHSSYEITNTNDQLWHYYNNVAQYYEWDKEVDSAIIEHEKCLKIPGVSQKWLSGTLVNLGISYRLRFLTTYKSSDIDKSINYGSMGVEIKTEIGDKDELPIALHNLALSIIYKFVFSKNNKSIGDIQSSLDYSNNAIHIYEETGSSKKMVMALFEYFLSSILMHEYNRNNNIVDLEKIKIRGKFLQNSIKKGFYDEDHFRSMKILLESSFNITIADRLSIINWIDDKCEHALK